MRKLIIASFLFFSMCLVTSCIGTGDKAMAMQKMPDKTKMFSEENYMKPKEEDLRKMLTPIQFSVTQKADTEPPFANKYWNNHEKGIYVDIVSGEPLFASSDKFDSGTGWPSFTRPLVSGNVVEHKDTSFGMTRIELKSAHADSHLGHLFDDGPQPTGLRYCINSASLKFIPLAEMESAGYGEFLKFVEK